MAKIKKTGIAKRGIETILKCGMGLCFSDAINRENFLLSRRVAFTKVVEMKSSVQAMLIADLSDDSEEDDVLHIHHLMKQRKINSIGKNRWKSLDGTAFRKMCRFDMRDFEALVQALSMLWC
jgi:hypothetical protein